MSESQSRYSIVERLTTNRLNIISEKLELESDLKDKQQAVEYLKKELADWEGDIQQGIERTRRLKKREIEKAMIECENSKERKKSREDALNEKIKSLDKAMERIEEISKISPTVQNS